MNETVTGRARPEPDRGGAIPKKRRPKGKVKDKRIEGTGESGGKEIVIIGAGGFGREVKWLIERINEAQGRQPPATRKSQGDFWDNNRDCPDNWNLLGFVDDGLEAGSRVAGSPVLGGTEWLCRRAGQETLYAACAIGSGRVRRQITERLLQHGNVRFPNLVDPSAACSGSVRMGRGNILCAGTVLTVDITLGDFCIVNLDCTIGHDARLESFVTLYPSVNLSGCVLVGEGSEIGTGSHVIQGITIGKEAVLGAGTVGIRDLPERCVAVGNPAKVIKYS